MDIAEKCMGETFSLTGDDGAEFFEGVYYFKYLERVLHQMDDEWPAVLRNIRRARQFWGRIWNLMRREGADMIISEKFYCAVVYTVLLFGGETWVLSAAMLNKLEGVHVGFLGQVKGVNARKLGDKNCTK